MNIDIKLDFSDVLILPRSGNVNTRKDVNLITEHFTKNSKQEIKHIPIWASNMDTIGTFEMARELSKHKMFTCLHKHYPEEDIINFFNNTHIEDFISISTGCNDLNKVRTIMQNTKCKYITLDIANGYCEIFTDTIRKLREEYPRTIIIAGNVVTAGKAVELIDTGADIIKLGIGPGSCCTTRKQTGIGYPQFSCIMDSQKDIHDAKGLLMSDGGCICPGDISKAFAAGSDFVMLGGMLSGHFGKIYEEHGKKYRFIYGMSSKTAMIKHYNNMENYRSSEGKCVKVPCRDINETIQDILGGVRSTCSYTGTKNIQDLFSNAYFIRVNRQLNEVFNKS